MEIKNRTKKESEYIEIIAPAIWDHGTKRFIIPKDSNGERLLVKIPVNKNCMDQTLPRFTKKDGKIFLQDETKANVTLTVLKSLLEYDINPNLSEENKLAIHVLEKEKIFKYQLIRVKTNKPIGDYEQGFTNLQMYSMLLLLLGVCLHNLKFLE